MQHQAVEAAGGLPQITRHSGLGIVTSLNTIPGVIFPTSNLLFICILTGMGFVSSLDINESEFFGFETANLANPLQLLETVNPAPVPLVMTVYAWMLILPRIFFVSFC
jgi:hypothetical protein